MTARHSMSCAERRPLMTTLAMLAVVSAALAAHHGFGNPNLFPVALLAALANAIYLICHRLRNPDARPPVRRSRAIWGAAVLLLPHSYVLGAPFVMVGARAILPAALPALEIVHTPLRWCCQQDDLPGAELFEAYAGFVIQSIDLD